MAARRGGGRVSSMLALLGVVTLATAYILVTGWNPWPRIGDWLGRIGTLSSPAPAWKARLPEQPTGALLTGAALVLPMPDSVRALDTRTGGQMWTHPAAWTAVAGDPGAGTAVVVAGRTGRRGYDVIDPDSGAIRWGDGTATGAWVYRDLVVAVACARPDACTLTARAPLDGTVRWRLALPGGGRSMSGLDPRLAGVRPLGGAPMDSAALAPPAAPTLIGIPVDGGVRVVSLAKGRLLGRYPTGATTRVVVTGDRVLQVSGSLRSGACRYTVTATEPLSGRRIWRRDGYDLGTADALGCDAHRDPRGAAGLLVAVDPAGADVLIDPASGAVLVTGGRDETLLATDGKIAVLRTGDGRAIRAVRPQGGGQAWRVPAGRHAQVSAGGYGVVVADVDAADVRVLDPATGATLLDVSTGGQVLGAGPGALVLGLGRSVGLLAVPGPGGATPAGPAQGGPTQGGATPVGPAQGGPTPGDPTRGRDGGP